MVGWAYILDDLFDILEKTRQTGLSGNYDSAAMYELSAMGDYNLARSRNMYGSLRNAYDQRAHNSRKIPSHMMPGFMQWLKTEQPSVYTFLYGVLDPTDAAPRYTAPPKPQPPPKPTDKCAEFKRECNVIGKSGAKCFRELSKKHHPDKGGSTAKFQQLNNCREKL